MSSVGNGDEMKKCKDHCISFNTMSIIIVPFGESMVEIHLDPIFVFRYAADLQFVYVLYDVILFSN